MREITLGYEKQILQDWKDKKLYEKWFKQFPDVFDKEDLGLARRRPSFHFGEWFVAKHYAEKGYKSLLEKFGCKNHDRKNKIISKYLNLKKLMCIPKFPDLFVYKNKEFFFVEVKKGGDRLNAKQGECFEKIKQEFGCEVILCNLEHR